ncbi:Lysophospholipase-like protein 1 [Lamellibrachia satsuma]|nr:Lysophospholipase-like protein 1 [Lamellibrachia satsuma]
MAFSRTALLKPIVVQSAERHTASLIFLHGSGDTGDGIKAWLRAVLGKELVFRNIRIIYPTAPLRPYTPSGGAVSRVWFDRKQISPFVPEDTETMEDACQTIGEIIDQEELNGIPRSRIVLGGFSMGAALSLYYGYQYGRTLAGIFALSGFLNKDSAVYETLQSNPGKTPQLYQGHGETDGLVPIEWGKTTSEKLASLGVNTSFHSYPIDHEMNWREIDAWTKWVEEILPGKY